MHNRVMTSGLDPPKRHREIHPQPQNAVSGMCETCQPSSSLQVMYSGL